MPWTKKGKLRALANLDLDPVRRLLVQKEKWTDEQTGSAEIAYRRFLTLMILHPKETLVPTDQIDSFWHMHMLDTRKYERDCKAVFGRFIHHDPHLAKGTPAHGKAYARTKQLENGTYGDYSSCSAVPVVAACGGSSHAGGHHGGDHGGDHGGGHDSGGHDSGGSSCGGSASCGSSCGSSCGGH